MFEEFHRDNAHVYMKRSRRVGPGDEQLATQVGCCQHFSGYLGEGDKQTTAVK